jgi:DNA-directed RNA polymerase
LHKELLYQIFEALIDNEQHKLPELESLGGLNKDEAEALINRSVEILARIIESEMPTPELIGYLGKKCHMAGKVYNVRDWPLLGSFLLLVFHMSGILIVEINEDNEAVLVDVDIKAIRELWNTTRVAQTAIKPTLVPSEVTKDSIFRGLKKAKKAFKSEDNHTLVRTLNKAAKRAWTINKGVLSLAIKLRITNGRVITNYLKSKSSEASDSKRLMINRIIDLAIEFSQNKFYSNYFVDFRARLYPYTGFLHEQSHDLARSLLVLDNALPLGKNGFNWIKHGLASHFAGATTFGVKSDKLSFKDRIVWVDSLSDKFRAYANNAIDDDGWVVADEPWQFIAKCIEYDNILKWAESGNEIENYQCNVICFVDGSCNGSQHLAALTRDEVSASHVNLVDRDTPGDLYAYVAAFVWRRIEELAQEAIGLEHVVDLVIELRKAARYADNKEPARNALKAYVIENKEVIARAAPLFWSRFQSVGERRKICKRNVMTMVYGVTRYGAGNQIMEDAPKHNIAGLEFMDNTWAIQLGNLIYNTMYESMPKSTALLKVFETAGKRIGTLGKELTWTTPNGFVVIQDYSISSKFTLGVPFDGQIIKAVGFDDENQIQIPSKQKSGAAPNVVHSLDAAHLMRVIDNCPGDVVTIHDSFGSVPGNMDNLSRVVREQFYSLYKNNPLPGLLDQLGVSDIPIEYGSYDVVEVLNSEFSFL